MPIASKSRTRTRIDRALFLGPAVVLLFMFFVVPVIVDIGIAFTDMGRNLKVTGFTTENFTRMFSGDSRLSSIMVVTLTYVLCTLAIFNVSYGLLLALLTTALPDRAGAFFRAVWILPRMSPSVVYALLWSWVVAPTDYGLLNQGLAGLRHAAARPASNDAPMLIVIILANGFIGASFGMIIFTSAIRSIPDHLFHAARVDGAGELAIVRHVTLPAHPLADLVRDDLPGALAAGELRVHPAHHQWRAVLRYDRLSLYAYRRAFENGEYAYGAALSLVLVVSAWSRALVLWR